MEDQKMQDLKMKLDKHPTSNKIVCTFNASI